jgi:hypothetical protein
MIRTCLSKKEYTELQFISEESGETVFKCVVRKEVGGDDLELMFDEVREACASNGAE